MLCDRAPSRDKWPAHAHTARAWAIYRVCATDPTRRGLEMLVTISTLICGRPDREDVIALAVKALARLCDAGVVDAHSSWKRLSPYLTKRESPAVHAAACTLVGNQADAFDDDNEELDIETTVFKADRVASLGHLWTSTGHPDATVRAAATTALARFHPSALVPQPPQALPTDSPGAAPWQPFGPASGPAYVGLLASMAHPTLLNRALAREIDWVGRATVVLWRRGVHRERGAAGHAAAATAAAASTASPETIAAFLNTAVATTNQSGARKAIAFGNLFLPATAKTAADHVAAFKAAVANAGGYDLNWALRPQAHTAWQRFTRSFVRGFLEAEDGGGDAIALREAATAILAECSVGAAKTPIVTANAVHALAGLAASMPLHTGLLPWLEGALVTVMSAIGPAASAPGAAQQPLFPVQRLTEVRCAACVGLVGIIDAMRSFGTVADGALARGAAALRSVLVDPAEEGLVRACAGIGLGLVVRRRLTNDETPLQRGGTLAAVATLVDVVGSPEDSIHRSGAAVGLGCVGTALLSSGNEDTFDQAWTQCKAAANAGDEAAVVHQSMWAAAAAERGGFTEAETKQALSEDRAWATDAPVSTPTQAQSRSTRYIALLTRLSPATLNEEVDALVAALSAWATSGDAAVRAQGLFSLAAVLLSPLSGATADAGRITDAVDLLIRVVEVDTDLTCVCAAATLLGRLASLGHGEVQTDEPSSLDYLPEDSLFRAVFTDVLQASRPLSAATRRMALAALSRCSVLPPVDWFPVLNHAVRLDSAAMDDAILLAVAHHKSSPSLQRYLCSLCESAASGADEPPPTLYAHVPTILPLLPRALLGDFVDHLVELADRPTLPAGHLALLRAMERALSSNDPGLRPLAPEVTALLHDVCIRTYQRFQRFSPGFAPTYELVGACLATMPKELVVPLVELDTVDWFAALCVRGTLVAGGITLGPGQLTPSLATVALRSGTQHLAAGYSATAVTCLTAHRLAKIASAAGPELTSRLLMELLGVLTGTPGGGGGGAGQPATTDEAFAHLAVLLLHAGSSGCPVLARFNCVHASCDLAEVLAFAAPVVIGSLAGGNQALAAFLKEKLLVLHSRAAGPWRPVVAGLLRELHRADGTMPAKCFPILYRPT